MKYQHIFSCFFTAFLLFAVGMFWLFIFFFHSLWFLLFLGISLLGAVSAYYLACEAKIYDL